MKSTTANQLTNAMPTKKTILYFIIWDQHNNVVHGMYKSGDRWKSQTGRRNNLFTFVFEAKTMYVLKRIEFKSLTYLKHKQKPCTTWIEKSLSDF